MLIKVACRRDVHLYSSRFLGMPVGEAAAVRAEGSSFAGERPAVPCVQGEVAGRMGQIIVTRCPHAGTMWRSLPPQMSK